MKEEPSGQDELCEQEQSGDSVTMELPATAHAAATSFAQQASTHEARSGVERFSAREELLALADEWIAAASDEGERKALYATKEALVAASVSIQPCNDTACLRSVSRAARRLDEVE